MADEPLNSHSGTSGNPDLLAPLTPERWQQIKNLFGLSLEHEPSERAAFLKAACGNDESLRAEIESLLAAADGGASATSKLLQAISPRRSEAAGEAEDPMLGRRIGDYRINCRIGYGGMAAVYLASRADEQFHMQVAVKVLRSDLDRSELLRRFLNERQTLAALDHSNIVKLLDGGSTEEGLPYLVMDYVQGSPIDEYCDAHYLPIEQRLLLFHKVCDAVQYAHQHRVIHRDLKPSNILVTADGMPKLLDFGISKVLNPSEASDITRTSNRHLTPAYASPEQVRGEPGTVATDVYSMGVVLYGLLTGHRPYRLNQRTPAALERAICEQEPESPSTAVDRVETETLPDGTTVTVTAETVSRTREGQPDKLRHSLKGDLDNIVLKALQKDPQRRYPSVEEFAQDIQRHLEHRPIQARRNTIAYRFSKFVRRRKTEVMAGAAVAMILVCAVAYSAWERRQATVRARAELVIQRAGGRRSVAVLGFRNLSARSDTTWLSTALSEMMTTELSAGGKLRTIPGENVVQTRINLSLPETDSLSRETLTRVYKNMGSDFVVLGSYLDMGGPDRNVRLDITVQDAALGETVASLAENGNETSLPDLVTRAGAAVRAKLGISGISPVETGTVRAAFAADPEATRLFAEGIGKLRAFDALGSRDLLEKAVLADPSFALAHSALADAWLALGYPAKANQEAKKAFDASGPLTREESLFIEARYRQTAGQRDNAIDLYRTLFNFFPDNLDYGLRLSAVQSSAGKAQDGLTTLDKLRLFPPPGGADPRIDLGEADAAKYTGDYKRQLAAATQAEQKGRAQGARMLVAQALVSEGEAYRSLGNPLKSTAASLSARQIFAAVGDRYGESRVLRNMGAVYFDQGDFESARKSFEESMRIRHELGNRAGEAAMLTAVATAFQFQKDFTRAREMFERSLAISRELGDKPTIGMTLANLGTLEKDIGEFGAAQQHLKESLAISREAGNPALVQGVLTDLGLLAFEQGDPVEARRLLEESVANARHGSDKSQLGVALEDLGSVVLATGSLSAALKLLTQARQVLEETGNDGAAANALCNIGDVLFAQGDLPGARKTYEDCLAIREHLGERGFAATTRLSLAKLNVEEHRAAEAEVSVRQVIEQFREQDDVNEQAAGEALLADIMLAQGNTQEAQNAVARARDLLTKTSSVMPSLVVNIVDARVHSVAGDTAEATRLLREAMGETRKRGLLSIQFDARLVLAEAEIRDGNPTEGVALLALLERDARAKEFLLVARKARAARMIKADGTARHD